MKQFQVPSIVIFLMICLVFNAPIQAKAGKAEKKQSENNALKKEITASLESWNEAAKSRNIKQFMELYDTSPDIMIVGSDSGEVYKGREQIEKWATKLISYASFSWDMKRIDIDANGKTAWVFMDGFMVVKNDKGKTARFPYRFTGILVKVKTSWKWRLFNGSVPGGH